ncbi:MAG: hypothetical protein ILA19_02975 [Bacilli bacterium]|nr:hypothetical protein [Bacilli bacterium]
MNDNDIFESVNCISSEYDIILDDDRLEDYGEHNMLFNDNNSIVLYTMLNKTNTELLKQGKYNRPIKAYEYYDIPNENQGECIIEIVYDTRGLFDTLHPSAHNIIKEIYKKLKSDKVEDITDRKVLGYINDNMNYTATRFIERSDNKIYQKSRLFKNQKICYIIKPNQYKYKNHKVN